MMRAWTAVSITLPFARISEAMKSNATSYAARRAGLDPLEVLAAMASEPIKEKLRMETAAAADLGIFGAPSFVTEDGELFWGNDRIDDALDWAVRGTLRPSSQN